MDALLRHLHAAGRLAVTEESLTARVVHRHAVDEQPVVVEARHCRRRGTCPVTFAIALHVQGTFSQAILGATGLHLDLLRVDCLDPERDSPICVNRGYIARGTLDVAGFPSSSARTLDWPPTKSIGTNSNTDLIGKPFH